MNIFLYELKAYRKSTIIWTAALAFICIFYLSVYPTFSSDAEEVKLLFSGFPPEVLAAFGFNIDTFFSVLGFYSSVFGYILLCGAIQGMNLGLSIISKESRNKTADFLLSKPVARTKVLTGKIAAVVISIVFTNVVYLIVSTLTALYVKSGDFSVNILILISLTLFFIQLIFAALGILIAVISKKIKSVISVSLAVVFCFFIMGMLTALIEDEIIRYLTPFKYFDFNYIINNSGYEIFYVLLSLAIIVVSIGASYIIYVKKDIPSV